MTSPATDPYPGTVWLVPDPGELISQDAASRALGVSRWTVRRIPSERLPYIEVGGTAKRAPVRRYRPEDVERYRVGMLQDGRLGELEATVADLVERVERLERGDAR